MSPAQIAVPPLPSVSQGGDRAVIQAPSAPNAAPRPLVQRDLIEMGEKNVPVAERVFGEKGGLRPNFLVPYRCKNILIEDVKIINSPMWEINPVLCTNVTVRGVDINSHGPNNDGCNPDSSSDVLIENTLFDVGDDCIAIKSGRNEDGRRIGRPSENIIIRGSTMKDGHAGVAIGSEIAGSCRNVFIENNRMDSPNLERALRLKSNARRGGVIENVFMRNVEVGQVSEALLTIDFMYEEGSRGNFPPTARNITMGLPASFVDIEDDHNIENPPTGSFGWTSDNAFVLLSDRWDIWKVPVAAGQPAVNLTVNGKKDQIRYTSRLRIDPNERGADLSKRQYISAMSE